VFALWNGMAHLPGAPRAIRNPAVRTVALFGAFERPWRVPAEVASGDVANLRRSDVPRAQRAVADRQFTGGRAISVPVTIALATRDPLIRRRDLTLSELPPHTRLSTLRGTGHVPTWDDPDAVAALIVETSARHRSRSVTRR
jgi:pimeloyl-ACP methyl ester carboxylesterase